MSEERLKKQLADLTFTFDGSRPDPARFVADPSDYTRPDPKQHAPKRPMPSADVAELVRLGNLNYAAFIQDCRAAGGVKKASIPDLPCRADHRLFLNKDEAGIGGVTAQEPYAAALSCIDARVPVELVTGQAANDTFVIRTAGNTLTGDGEGSGSLRYILSHYGVGSKGKHPTVSAVFVFGHTRCGAVEAAYEAFKKGGTGVGGLHSSLADILLEIKHAVDFVLAGGADKYSDEMEIKNAISHVNAVLTAVRARQMVDELGVGAGVKVHYANYHVDDFYLRKTSFPKHSGQKLAEIIKKKGFVESLALDASGARLRDDEAQKALLEDAVEFAKKK
jgi:carbonic anhydrase